ncbi:MAG: YwaF family protein [Lachnospiraceae bacterium]|nr:YwaF family protein [Lachnospiraceae bacterium]
MTFWLEERDLPEGSGFQPWGGEHLAVIAVVVLFLAVSLLLYRRPDEKKKKTVLYVVAFLLPALEVWKILMLTVSGCMGIGHLPLHLCSMAIYLYPVSVMTKTPGVRETLTEIGTVTLLPAALGAILFPDWTMYPILNFYSLHAFVWHTLQILFPLLCLLDGRCRPDIRHLWKNTVFLLAGGIPIGMFDRFTGCNYWFLLRPVSGTPLQWLYDLFGKNGYLLSLLILATLFNLAVYGVCYALRTGVGKFVIDRKK